MKRKKQEKQYLIYVFFLLLLGIGLGYAIIHSDLVLNGTANIGTNTWDIHFNNVQVATGSVTATTPATINSSDNTKVNYAITLEKPGDYYEFTVDIVNAGTLPGKISLVSITGINPTYEDIIEYSVNYNNGNPVQVGNNLNAGATKTVKVRTYFNENIDKNDLPATDFNLNIEVDITYIQSDEEEVTTETIIQQLKTENSSCFTKYEGEVTDEVNNTVTASNVYFNKCADKRNIKFAGYCWQMIRTTENSGIKMIYNGEPDNNGRCGSSRGTHKGIVQSNSTDQTLSSSYLYGSSFTYDITTSEFTLTDTETATWSDSTYENLIGKFTCKTTSDTCTTIYQINSYASNTNAYLSYYTIADTNYAQIGTSSYNANHRSPAMVGYMFNKVYNYTNNAPTSGSLMGNDVSYSNGIYTLLPADGESELGTTKDDTHHYTCNTTSSTCSKVRYYYNNNNYIELDGAENIQAALNEMLYNNDVNTFNSSIKGIIDSWYAQNLSTKTNMLEDIVYCNARNISNQSTNGWNKDGKLSIPMYFKISASNNDISCASVTDQFAVSNNKAKLTYPVALATYEELYTLTNNNTLYDSLTKTGAYWWGLSPDYYYYTHVYVRYVYANGRVNGYDYPVYSAYGARPVVSLASGNVISSGTGSETDPWVVE